jgi:NitT/TauT family transport system permease protein
MTKILKRSIVPLAVLFVWFLITYYKVVSPIFLPPLGDIWDTMRIMAFDHGFIMDITYTVVRALVSYVIAAIIGTGLGLIMGHSKKVYESLDFTVDFARSIPTTALFPLFILFFGIGDLSKVVVTVWGASLIILINTMHGVHLVKASHINLAKINHFSPMQVFRKIIFPSALPSIFTGYRLAISICLIVTVVTEMFIGTEYGLGQRIITDQLAYNLSDMYATILATGIIGYLFNQVIVILENSIVHWKGK